MHNITSYPTILGEKEPVAERPVRYLFMGEIGQRKGVFDIIRALANHCYELKCKIELLIGDNKMEDEFRKAIANGGLSEFVKFEGWVSGDKKIKLLNWADVYILPFLMRAYPSRFLRL